ncbi:MAG: agmatine deiminase family protein [Flavobacteriales bacterium]
MSNDIWRFPAEWEKQQAVLLCFPHNGNDWPGKYGAIQWAFVEFIKKVADVEQVILIVASEQLKISVLEKLKMADVNQRKVKRINSTMPLGN